MKSVVLLELAKRWEEDALVPKDRPVEDSEQGRIIEAKNQGAREQLRACADSLKMLVDLLG